MRQILFLVLTLSIATLAQAGPSVPIAFAGNWHGVGLQTDGSNWSIEVSVGPEQATVTYPTLNCGGNWQYQSMSEEGLSAIETIEYGRQACIETGNIFLMPFDHDKIIYLWCSEELALVAFAILARGDPENQSYAEQKAVTLEALEAPVNHLKSISCPREQWLGV